MRHVFVRGVGAVSPAGWGADSLCEAVRRGVSLPPTQVSRPGWSHALRTRNVPPPVSPLVFQAHPRVRRSSPVARYAMAAALEALGGDAKAVGAGSLRLGVIFCAMAGCVTYSRRFYEEILKDPATASPLIFPETVFNAPASHLAALLGTTAINYTLIGDPGMFLQGLALAADWVLARRVDGGLVVAAEETDWLVAEASHLFDPQGILGEGAGAIYLSSKANGSEPVELTAVTDPYLFTTRQTRTEAAQRARAAINLADATGSVLSDSQQGVRQIDQAETEAWRDWPGDRLSPKTICGDGLMAAAAWQCVAAVDAIARNGYPAATVSVVGNNQQAIAAQFTRAPIPAPVSDPLSSA